MYKNPFFKVAKKKKPPKKRPPKPKPKPTKPVKSKVKPKPVKKKPSCIKRKLDVSRLKCLDVQSELREKLMDLLPAPPMDTDTAEHAWTVFRNAVFSAAESTNNKTGLTKTISTFCH